MNNNYTKSVNGAKFNTEEDFFSFPDFGGKVEGTTPSGKSKSAVKKKESRGISYLPESPGYSTMRYALTAGKNMDKFAVRRSQTGTADYAFKLDDDGRAWTLTNTGGTSDFILSGTDIGLLNGKNSEARKLLDFVFIEANRQNIIDKNGLPTKKGISFLLKDFAKVCGYKSEYTARQAFDTGANVLTSLKAKGTLDCGRVKHVSKLRVLFTGADIDNNTCTLYFNDDVGLDWNLFFWFITIYPERYLFKLSDRARNLLLNLLTQARQNVGKIVKDGFFTVKLRTVQEWLCLPSERDITTTPERGGLPAQSLIKDNTEDPKEKIIFKATKNPQYLIRNPIEKAVDEINKAHKDYYHDEGIKLELLPEDADRNAMSISDFLDNGRIKVNLSEDFGQYFFSVYETNKKEVARARQREGYQKKKKSD